MQRLMAWLADHDIWWLVSTVPLLVFPGKWNVVGLALLPCPWLCRWLGRGRPSVRTPVDWAMGLLALMIPVTWWATALPEVTRGAIFQLLAGMATFYGIVNWASSEKRAGQVAQGVVGLGVALALLALVGVKWSPGKLFALSQLYERLPLLLPDPIHPNVMAGALSLIIPIALSLTLSGWAWGDKGDRGIPPHLCRLAMGASSLAMSCILLLTKSRGAYMAFIVALLVVGGLHSRRVLTGLPVVLAGLTAIWWRMGTQPLMDWLMSTRALGGWEGRQEVWSRAAYMMQDFPFTGIGMGTFNQIANVMYPFFLAGPDAEVPHAHNLFLQVGVDLGFPGLIAYLALLMLCFWMACQVRIRSPVPSFQAALAAGLLGSLATLVVHGLTDAVMWVAKPAVITWALFGLTTALYNLTFTPCERLAEEG